MTPQIVEYSKAHCNSTVSVWHLRNHAPARSLCTATMPYPTSRWLVAGETATCADGKIHCPVRPTTSCTIECDEGCDRSGQTASYSAICFQPLLLRSLCLGLLICVGGSSRGLVIQPYGCFSVSDEDSTRLDKEAMVRRCIY